MQFTCEGTVSQWQTGLFENIPGIDVFLNKEGGYTGLRFSINQNPVDRRGSPVLGKQGSVKIDGPQAGHPPNYFRKHSERYHHKQFSVQCLEVFNEIVFPEAVGL